jgi:serine O-acetyltransferase
MQEQSSSGISATPVPSVRPRLWALLREDSRHYRSWFVSPGFHAMVMYRLGRWALDGPVYRKPVLWLARALHVFVRNIYGIELYPDADIGRRFVISRQGSIVIHQYCTIGDDCSIRQGATIGAADFFDRRLAPLIGNNVRIDVGAVVMGKVSIGNNVLIDANAVVGTDVPDNSKVLAPASRVISWG